MNDKATVSSQAFNWGKKLVPNNNLDLSNLHSVVTEAYIFQLSQLLTGLKVPQTGFNKNDHGHIVLTTVGRLGRTGNREIDDLTSFGYCLSPWVKSCLLSEEKDGYDNVHRLVPGHEYKIVLMPAEVIADDRDRTTSNLREYGVSHYQYVKPLAGVATYLRKVLPDNLMTDLGFQYIVVPHDELTYPKGYHPGVFFLQNSSGFLGPQTPEWDQIVVNQNHWPSDSAVAFFASAN